MPEGGRLTVHGRADATHAIVELADTGTGIPEGFDIWSPFKTTKQLGTGFGLVIVQQTVAAHRGTIDYASVPSTGTTFGLTLPLAPSRPTALP